MPEAIALNWFTGLHTGYSPNNKVLQQLNSEDKPLVTHENRVDPNVSDHTKIASLCVVTYRSCLVISKTRVGDF